MAIRATRCVAHDYHAISKHAEANHSLLAIVLAHVFGLEVPSLEHELGVLEVQLPRGERLGPLLWIVGDRHAVIVSTSTRTRKSYSFVTPNDGEPAKGKKRGRARNAPKFDLRTQLFKMCGVDLTRIDGIDVTTALAVISKTGADMSRFPTVGHFASWLGLCPGTKITGGKVMSGITKRVANRAAQALRLAAAALRTSQSALGAYFRRMCSRMDKPKAVTAAAHKLARLIYTMLT